MQIVQSAGDSADNIDGYAGSDEAEAQIAADCFVITDIYVIIHAGADLCERD